MSVLPIGAKITLEEAEEIARAECARRGWSWVEPVSRDRQLRHYRFWTNAESIGGNVEIRIRADSGAVKRAWVGLR